MRNFLYIIFAWLIFGSAAFAQAPPIPPGAPSNWYSINQGGKYLATTSFMAYCAYNKLVCTTGSQSTNVQNFYLDSQVLFYQLVGAGNFPYKLPSTANMKVLAVVEPGYRKLTSTVIVPENVAIPGGNSWYRDSSLTISSPCTTVWWDGSDCNDLVNTFQPMFMGAYNSFIEGLNLTAKDLAGANKGSGYSDRGWEVGSILSTGGNLTGYTNGETAYLANPSSVGGNNVAGSTAATYVTLTVSGGSITNVTLQSAVRWNPLNGSYNLPPALQDRQYVKPAFIAATGVTTFLNDGTSPTGCYIITGVTSGANGACVRVAWWPDWCSNAAGGSGDSHYISCPVNNTYEGKFGSNQVATVATRNEIAVYDAGLSNGDAQFGDMFGEAFNFKNEHINGQNLPFGGYRGATYSAVDNRINYLNPTSNTIGSQLRAGQTHINQYIADSDTQTCLEAGADQATGGGLSTSIGAFECFLNGSAAAQLTGYAFDGASLNSDTSRLMGWTIPSMVFANTGSAFPAINADYWGGGNDLNVIVPNYGAAGGNVTYPVTKIINFGSHMNQEGHNYGNLVTGVGDNMSGSVFSGTWPVGFGAWWWDAYTNGFLAPNGTYVLWGAGPPTNGTTGLNKAIVGSTYQDYTNGALYEETGPSSATVWNKFTTNFQDVQNFTSTATWTKPSFCTGSVKCTTTITAIGAGGSGGGGAMETPGTVGSGGGGGGSGECVVVTLATADLGATQTATVATAPTGGLGATVAGPGADGNQGGDSFFSTFITAYGGGRGGGGQTTASSGGGGGAGINAQGGNATGTTAGAVIGTYSVAGGTAANGPTASTGGSFRPGAGGAGSSVTVAFSGGGSMCASGGGSGGTLLAGSAVAGGPAGLIPGIVSGTTAQGGAGGTTGGTGGAAVPLGGLSNGLGATGSGGGGANTAGAGGPGGPAGTATYGYGGGGGGAGTTAGGNGGAGGAGYVLIVTTGQ